jgi:PAS domain S-box-containing protein
MVGLFGLFLLASYLLTYSRILKSMMTLQAGAAVIGSGNLDFKIEEKKKNDEIGDLSYAFNRMTANLKDVTASRSELEREIADRKKVEEELRGQREWLRVTLTSIGDAVMAADAEGRITFLNPVAVTLTGWQFEEALGQPITRVFQIINEKTHRPAGDLVGRVLSEKRVVALANDTALVTKDGHEITIEDSAAPILDSAGNVIGAVLVFHDVTEKRRVQAALREAHERTAWLARLPEENPNPVVRVSSNGNVLYRNDASAKMPGWVCEVGQPLPHALLPLVGRALTEKRQVEQEVELAGRFYIAWVAPFPGEGYANVYGRDISLRKRAEEASRENEERLKRAQEIAHLGSWELNLVNNRLMWSDEVYRIFGLQPQEFGATYEAFLQAVHPDDRASVNAAYSGSLREGRDTYEIEHRVVKKSTGEIRIVHEKCEHTRDGSGRIIRSIGMVHDITERKQAEEALHQRTLELQQLTENLEQRVKERTWELAEANKALRQLSTRLLSAQEEERKKIANELHDTIGAYLSGIKFKVENALQEITTTPKAATKSLSTIVPVIQEAVEECRRIQMDLRPSMLDDLGLLPTLSWFCRRFQTIYSGIRVDQEMAIEESEMPNSVKIVIYRVVQEAMNNIAKHSQANLVHLCLRKIDGRIELSVEDNGRGFSVQQCLLLDNSRHGLGLKSMRERTELSGGSFAVESAEGRGTMVRVLWPLPGKRTVQSA